MDLAIDRKTLVRVVLEGLGRPANQLMPTSFFGGSKNLPERPYDVAKAKQLLADAGYPKGFEIDFHCTNNRLPGDSAVCEALSQMWARAGLKVNANALNGTVFFPAQQKGEFSLWMSGWGTLTGEASYTYGSLVHTADPSTGLGAFNKQGYSNPEVDKLLQEGSRTMDDTKRRALFEKVDGRLHDRPRADPDRAAPDCLGGQEGHGDDPVARRSGDARLRDQAEELIT